MTTTLSGQFVRCLQDSQDYGSDDQHMVSRVDFVILADGAQHSGWATVKQIAGGDFETDPLEVSAPRDYKGPNFGYTQFRDAAERYYRHLVGAGGHGIRIGGNAKNIRMRNNVIVIPMPFTVDATTTPGGW